MVRFGVTPSNPASSDCAAGLEALLDAVVASEPLPDWTAAQWVAVLRAPQASPRVAAAAAERGMAGAAIIARAEVSGLLLAVNAVWPGSLHAMGGALAAARQLQQVPAVDMEAAVAAVVVGVQRARASRGRWAPAPTRTIPVDPAKLLTAEPVIPRATSPSRVPAAVDWMLGFVPGGARLSHETRLDIESGVGVFLEWYCDRLSATSPPMHIVAIQPTRALPPKHRLSARLPDADMTALVAGPPGARGCPVEQAWQRGMGHWAIVAILTAERGGTLPVPSAEARAWWAVRLHVLAARTPISAAATASLEQDLSLAVGL